MGREHSWNKKDVVEGYLRVDLAQVKFKGDYADLSLSWGEDGSRGSICLIVDLSDLTARFKYKNINGSNGEETDLDYTIPLDATGCYYGGRRYWFKCQAITPDGTVCNRRVRALYNGGKYYICRHCLGLSYQSKQETLPSIPEFRALKILSKREQQMATLLPIKRCFYNGKPTKKYQRYLKMEAKFERNILLMGLRSGIEI